MKQFSAQKEAMRMQHQHEQLAFLQARNAKEYQKFCRQKFQWPEESDLFRGVPFYATRVVISVIDCIAWGSGAECF